MIIQSKDDVKDAYQTLLSLEKENRKIINSDEADPAKLDENLSRQGNIMAEIESNPELDEQFQSENPDYFESLMETFKQIRDQNESLIEEEVNKIESTMESLDQSVQLMEHYMQGEQRREEGTSMRFDEEA